MPVPAKATRVAADSPGPADTRSWDCLESSRTPLTAASSSVLGDVARAVSGTELSEQFQGNVVGPSSMFSVVAGGNVRRRVVGVRFRGEQWRRHRGNCAVQCRRRRMHHGRLSHYRAVEWGYVNPDQAIPTDAKSRRRFASTARWPSRSTPPHSCSPTSAGSSTNTN